MTSSASSEACLVVAPTFAFDRLERALTAGGWERQTVPTAPGVLIPGEPELAAFRSPSHAVRAVYTCSPAVRYRVLAFSGDAARLAALEVAQSVPILDLESVRDFLTSTDEALVMVALFAARDLRLFKAADRVERFCTHENSHIAAIASATLEELTRDALVEGVRHLQALQTADPDRSALFPCIGDRHVRRQLVRRLIHDGTSFDADVLGTLRAALADEDWEVRASAMIAAVRLRYRELGLAIRKLDFPEPARTTDDRSILHAMQQESLAILAGAESPARTPMLEHLRRVLRGETVQQHDRVFLYVHSLAQPLQFEAVETTILPKSDLPFARVHPIEHWIGSDDEDIPANPIRLVRPDRLFAIAAMPLAAADAIRVLTGSTSEIGGSYRCTESEAREILRRLGQPAGVALTFPTATQWEMAMRGTDGRRRPWGNGWEGDASAHRSPWGLGGLSSEGEWAIEGDAMVVCGADREMRCAWRRRPRPGEACLLRPALPA